MKAICHIIAPLLLAAGIVQGQEVHVDACAAGPGDGTWEHPFSTLTSAAAAAPPGADILMRGGVYPESLGISQAVTITSYEGAALVGSSIGNFEVGIMDVCVPVQVVVGELACPADLGACAGGGVPSLNARVYYPTYEGRMVCGSPAVVYAHGFRFPTGGGSCSSGAALAVEQDYLQAEGILRRLAASGIIVIAFDASCGPYDDSRGSSILNALAYLRDQNQPGGWLAGAVDLTRIGFAGHSLGGGGAIYAATHLHHSDFAVLNLGQVEVQAVALIAPGLLVAQGYLSDLRAPTLTIYGTSDPTLTTESYNAISSPKKHLVVITGANHFGYTDDICVEWDLPSTVGGAEGFDARARQQAAARDYLHAFFSHYLQGNAGAIDYLTQEPPQRCNAGDPPTCGSPRRRFEDLDALNVEVGVCSCVP